jgi:hypothetical protein
MVLSSSGFIRVSNEATRCLRARGCLECPARFPSIGFRQEVWKEMEVRALDLNVML